MTLLAADFIAKLYTFIWPLARITAALMTVPVISVEAANSRVRLMLSLALAALVFPMFNWPTVDPMSAQGIAILVNEIAIGIIIGLVLQVATASLLLAGQTISSSMGLSIATLLDPTFGNVPTIAQLLLILGTLIFLGMGGHLLIVSILFDSFEMLPVGQHLLTLESIHSLLVWGSMIFLGALLIALPLMASLLLINLGLGVVTRAAPSLNIFVVGLPAIILAGFLLMIISLESIANRIQWIWLQSFTKIREILGLG
jgi:flagellar biosynthetic protein FliR